MKTVFLLCTVFTLSVLAVSIKENVVIQPNKTQEVRSSALLPQLAGRTTKDKLLTLGDIKHNRDSCLPGWYAYGSRCFKLFTTSMSWTDAENYCSYFGANLASIHNPGEHGYIKELASMNASPSYWIGGSDAVKSFKWLWSDGFIFRYDNWDSGEPNDVDDKENCIEMTSHSGWNDRNCEDSLPFVCGTRPYGPY